MANNYMQYSAILYFSQDPEQREIERQWCELVLGEEPRKGKPKKEWHAVWDEVLDNMDVEFDLCADIEEDGVWFSDESGIADLSQVAHFAQSFLKKFGKPGDYFAMSWAFTCDKPRIGEFGGGAMFVTATHQEWLDVDTWLEERLRLYRDVQNAQGLSR